MASSPDGQRVYVGNIGRQYVSVIDVASGTVLADVPVGGPVLGVAVTPDGRTPLAADMDGDRLMVIDTGVE